MRCLASRRGLTTLPLIGGGVTLIGTPSAVAEPITPRLLREYHDWLMFEWSSVTREIEGGVRSQFGVSACSGAAYRWHRAHGELRRDSEGGLMGDGMSFPSTRAALVLSTVGCDWREGSACL